MRRDRGRSRPRHAAVRRSGVDLADIVRARSSSSTPDGATTARTWSWTATWWRKEAICLARLRREQDETRDGKLRAKVFSPVEGWVSVKCLAPICDRWAITKAGKAILEPQDVSNSQVTTRIWRTRKTHGELQGALGTPACGCVEINHEAMYAQALESTGLQYGPGFRLCTVATINETDAVGNNGGRESVSSL